MSGIKDAVKRHMNDGYDWADAQYNAGYDLAFSGEPMPETNVSDEFREGFYDGYYERRDYSSTDDQPHSGGF